MRKKIQQEDLRKTYRRLRNRLTDALLELDAAESALPAAAPEPAPGSRRNRYQQQIDVNESTGSWRKPAQLKKNPKKSA